MTSIYRYVDLHTHSHYSDGTYSPEGLVILAKKTGLRAIALTDHDTTDGLALFHSAGKEHGIETISGIELACRYEYYHRPELHIVGLGFSSDSTILLEYMAQIQQDRSIRNKAMAARLTALGLPLTLEELEKSAGGEIITRAHFANILLQKGYVHTRSEAFEHYLSDGKPGFLPRTLPSPKDCIELIHHAGGAAILAHPTLYNLSADQIDDTCGKLKTLGLDGIECHYPAYTSNQRKFISKIARKHDLLPSGGSDFHGENKPDIQLGVGKGNLTVPYSLWENITAKTAQIRRKNL